MKKRWWLLILVLLLALPLTSCSRKRTAQLMEQYGFGYCDGTLGSFDVYVIRYPNNPALFQISIIPVQLDAPGDIISVTIANESLAYKEMITQVVAFSDVEIQAGPVTEGELYTYDILVMTPYQPGVSFLEVNAEKDAICTLPMPANGVTPTK